MSTEQKSVQGSETSTTEKKPVTTVTCIACEKSFTADDDHIWLMPLRTIEAAIRKTERLERWARPEDLKKHAMCGQCGHLVRESGGKTFRLSATLKMVVERKAAAEQKRRDKMEASQMAEREAAKAKLGQLYDLKVTPKRDRGRFTGEKQVKVVELTDADDQE